MNKLLLLSGLLLSPLLLSAQGAGSAISQKVGLYVFPANGQTEEQMEQDQSDCYTWAVEQSGVDPLNPPKVEAAEADTSPQGEVVGGAAKGAAMGAAIGAIAGDAGKGAAIGAATGGFGGMRRRRVGNQQEAAANQQAAAQASANYMEQFKKAYSVCLEGKGYTVK